MTVRRDDLLRLLGLLDVTEAEEIDCAEFLERVAAFVERMGPDGTPPSGHEDLVQHLKICPECLEECQALLRALREPPA